MVRDIVINILETFETSGQAEVDEDLKAKYETLEGELDMRKRDQYRKCSEKPKDEGRRL